MDITTEELARRFKAVRDLQIAYFKRRDTGILEQSKKAEKDIDRLIADILEPSMFGDGE